MLLYLYGPDSYRRDVKLRELISRYEKKNGKVLREVFLFNDDLDAEELKTEVARFSEFLTAQSLFPLAKVVEIGSLAETTKDLLAILKREAESEAEDLLLIVSVPKKLPKPLAFLEKNPKRVYEFENLTAGELLNFLKAEAARREFVVSAEALRGLVLEYESDSWGAVRELERMALGGILETSFKTPDFFPLVQAVKSTLPLAARLKALTILLEREEPAAVFNIIASMAFSAEKEKMADYDVAIKSGKLDYPEALLDFVLGASSSKS